MHPGPILGVKDKDPKYDYDKNQTSLDKVDERLIAGLYLNQNDLQLLQAEQVE